MRRSASFNVGGTGVGSLLRASVKTLPGLRHFFILLRQKVFLKVSAGATSIYAYRRWIAAALLGCFILACIRYAQVQDIWIDESTQLSGVRLPLVDLVGWLAGNDAGRFGVPGDRMPPLAYLFDHLWWAVAGDAVFPFRLFHILLAAAGVALVARAEIKALGARWLGMGLAFLVLSPKLIDAAAELRCYPLFFAATCGVLALFLDLVAREERPVSWRKLLPFGAACLALCYIHFFGVVAAFSFFATLMLVFARDRASLVRVLFVGAVLAICLLGLYPFIFGATSVSMAGATAGAGDLLHYLPLLLGHPALLLYPVAALLYFAAGVALIVAAAWGAARRAAQRQTDRLDWLLVVAAIGCIATIVPGFLISTFDTLKPSYSIWLLPVFALIIALGASRPIGLPAWDRYGRFGAITALLIGAGIATAVFLIHAPWFIHGPQRTIAAVRAASPTPTAILYTDPETYAVGYFPMVYQTHGAAPQWLARAYGLVRLPDDGTSPTLPLTALAPYRSLVVVDIRMRHYADLRDCLHGRCPVFPPAPLVDDLVRSGRWSVTSSTRAFGFYDAVVTRLIARRP